MVWFLFEILKIGQKSDIWCQIRYLYLACPSTRIWPQSRKLDQKHSFCERMTLSDPILRSFCIFDQLLCVFHEFLSNVCVCLNFHQNCPKYAHFGDFPDVHENGHFGSHFTKSHPRMIKKWSKLAQFGRFCPLRYLFAIEIARGHFWGVLDISKMSTNLAVPFSPPLKKTPIDNRILT